MVQWGAFREIHSIKGFNGHDTVLAVEKARVMAFAPRGTSLGSEGCRNRGRHSAEGAPFACDVGIRLGW